MPDQMTEELTTMADRLRKLAAGMAVGLAQADLESAASAIDSAVGNMPSGDRP